MSLPKQSIHLRLTPEMHEKLRLMAGVQGKNMTEHGELLLEKMIVAEYHTLSLQLERMQRLGLTGSEGDNHGR